MKREIFRTPKIESLSLLAILSIIWGSSFILIKEGLKAFSPEQVGTIRISFAFLFMLPFALKHVKNIPRGKWKVIFFTGMVGNLIPAILFALAETKLESSLTGVLNALSLIFTIVIAVFIYKFRIRSLQVVGIATGFLGTIGLSFVNPSGGIGRMNIYIWFIVIATLCYGLSLNFIKEYLSGVRAIVITSLAMLSVGPIALVYLFSTDFINVVFTVPGAFVSLTYVAILGVFGTAIALILYTRLIQMTTPVFASLVTYIIPVVAILWGLLDNEILYPLHFAGMFLILLGIFIINKSENYNRVSNTNKYEYGLIRRKDQNKI